MKIQRWRRGAYLLGIIILALALWPPGSNGADGSAAEAIRYRAKQTKLLTAIVQGRPSARQRFTEGEINGYLDQLLDANSHVRQARWLRVGVEGLHCDVGGQHASLFVSGRLMVIPFVLEYRMTNRIDKVQSVRLGRLPLVQPLKWIAVGHLNRLSNRMQPERRILEYLKAFEVEGETIQVTVAPESRLASTRGSLWTN